VEETEAIQLRHGAIFRELLPEPSPTAGSKSATPESPRPRHRARDPTSDDGLRSIYRSPRLEWVTRTVVIDRGAVARAKPRLISSSPVRWPSVSKPTTVTWSATRSGTCSRRVAPTCSASGLLSGGYGVDELLAAGAFRV